MATKLNRISEWRKRRGMSQQELAEKLGTHWVTLSKLERGVQKLTFTWMQQIATALDIEPKDIISDDKAVSTVPVGGVIDEENHVAMFYDDVISKVDVHTSVFQDAFTDWLYVKSDVAWPYFRKGDLLGFTHTIDDAEDFIGRICIFQTLKNEFIVGMLSHGRSSGYYNVQVGNSKPYSNLKGRVYAFLATALFELPKTKTVTKDELRAIMDAVESRRRAAYDVDTEHSDT